MKTVRKLGRSDFEKRFGTDKKCLMHLADMKWGNGYSCKRCCSINYYEVKNTLNRRCKGCGYEESPTAGTLFHKVKFGIHKAFGMVYDILLSKKGANSMWLGERYEVSQNTAWLFRRKVQQYMVSSKKNPLTGQVHVDEFEIGTPKEGEQGRSASDKKVRVVIAAEIREKSVGNAYAQVIGDFSAKSLKKIFDEHVSSNAEVKTDGWKGYSPLKQLYKKLVQEESDKGRNFPQLHIQIRNLKNWLRGVHSYCGKNNVQEYLNEYFYRLNRRNNRESMLELFLKRAGATQALTLKQIVAT